MQRGFITTTIDIPNATNLHQASIWLWSSSTLVHHNLLKMKNTTHLRWAFARLPLLHCNVGYVASVITPFISTRVSNKPKIATLITTDHFPRIKTSCIFPWVSAGGSTCGPSSVNYSTRKWAMPNFHQMWHGQLLTLMNLEITMLPHDHIELQLFEWDVSS